MLGISCTFLMTVEEEVTYAFEDIVLLLEFFPCNEFPSERRIWNGNKAGEALASIIFDSVLALGSVVISVIFRGLNMI